MKILTTSCCGCSLKTGARSIAVFKLLVFTSLGIFAGLIDHWGVMYDSFFRHALFVYPALVHYLVNLVANFFLFFGTWKGKRPWVCAWLWMTGLSAPFEIIAALFYLILKSDQNIPGNALLVQFLVFLSSIPVGFYLFWVVFSFYQSTQIAPPASAEKP